MSALGSTASRPCDVHAASRQPSLGHPLRCLVLRPDVRRSSLVQQPQQRQVAQQQQRGVRTRAAEAPYGTMDRSTNAPADGYMALGVAHCFEKGDDGKLRDLYLIEPIAAPMLECMVTGAPTSFLHVLGTTVAQAQAMDKSALPAEFGEASWCDDYEARVGYAARTWLRPHPQDNLLDIVPLGKLRSNFNKSLDRKRVINAENVVTDSDNIKQDKSIDVYGRKDAEDDAAAKPKEAAEASSNGNGNGAAAAADDDDDDLDSLLSA